MARPRRLTHLQREFVNRHGLRPGQAPHLNTDLHCFVVTVGGRQEGRFSTHAAAIDTARDLSALNTKPWSVRDSVTGLLWTNQRAA